MQELRDILYKTNVLEITGQTDMGVSGISFDSRRVRPGHVFVAVPGTQTDGHLYIAGAIIAGARAVVCEKIPDGHPSNVTFIRVESSATALSHMAANYFRHPSKKLKLIGITGTNGKTSTASLLFDLFTLMGFPCGLISTIHNIIIDKVADTTHTTPDPLELNSLLHDMEAAGCAYVFMEVSSHAVVQKRIEGIHFSGGVFTNITHDHLDYHKDFREYILAKKAFFDGLPGEAFALTNADDKNGMVMLQNCPARKTSYGMQTMADYHARLLENNLSGMHLQIDRMEVWCRLTGRFNAYNLLAVYAVARLLGFEREEILTHLSKCRPPLGRFEHFAGNNQVTAIVDYAHTPDALENVLTTIHHTRSGSETLITVVGCGGNRDTAKRPLMASIAAQNSDKVVLTSDNPRMEDPEKIIEEMKTGLNAADLRKTLTIVNRREAIFAACAMARPGDIILVAGKGHEKYQEIKGVKYPFDDRQILTEALAVVTS